MSPLSTRRIYDFGMNVAEDTEYYLKRGFSVVAVEADPVMCAQASERFRDEVESGVLTILNVAIGERAGVFKFYVCNELSAWSTASEDHMKQFVDRGVTFKTVDVQFTTADVVMEENGAPYYAKIDIEGHDLICLEQISSSKRRPKYVSFEVDFANVKECLNVCRSMGYRQFAMADQGKVAGQTLPTPSREGSDVRYAFRLGQSGPFGDDLQQPWLNYDNVLAECRKIRRQSRLAAAFKRIGRVTGAKAATDKLIADYLSKTQTWYDIHARQSSAAS